MNTHLSNDCLAITLSLEELRALVSELEETFASPRREYRWVVTESVTVFWKKRDGESRGLLAHPSTEEWVATVALEESRAHEAVAELRALKPGGRFSIDGLPFPSNLAISIELAGS